jgi:uncharacterized protein
MSLYTLVPHNAHDLNVGGKHMLMHVPTTGLFEMDEVSSSVLNLFKEVNTLSTDTVLERLGDRFDESELLECFSGFASLNILQPDQAQARAAEVVPVEDVNLSTIILNVNTGCNLSCTYCYKEDLTTPAKGQKMEFATARSSVDLLLQQARGRDQVNIVFFGGEPLSNMPLIREVVAYATPAAARQGMSVDYSLTTNGTMLNEEIIDWLDQHQVAITVSMDGPKALHDKNRLTVGGKGTYDVVAAKVKLLLSRYRARPVGVRVTLTEGVTDVIAIHDHMINDLGFAEVGFGPVTSGPLSAFNLGGDSLAQVFSDMKLLGERYVDAAIKGVNIGFSNMHQLLSDITAGTRKVVPCGAGLGMLAVDNEGDLHLCHRFVGSEQPTYGNVDKGIEVEKLSSFIETTQDRSQFGCATCRIRSLCAGGCYHESYVRSQDPHAPVYHYCDLLRDWVDFGLRSYMRIIQQNPAYIEKHISPRRKAS